MKQLSSFFEKSMNLIEGIESKLMIVGLIFITLMVFLQVILRYFFHTGIMGSEEVSRMIFVFITWVGASLGVKEKEHIQITILSDAFPKMKKYLDVFSSIVCIGICVFLVISGIQMVELVSGNNQVSAVLKIPISIAYGIIPVSGFLMGVKYIRQFIGEMKILIPAK